MHFDHLRLHVAASSPPPRGRCRATERLADPCKRRTLSMRQRPSTSKSCEGQVRRKTKDGDAIPALLHVLWRLYLLAALLTATARGTLPDC